MPNTFHAGHKLAWLEQVASDRRTSDFHVRVSIAISRRADRTGVAAAGQESLARFIGATDRGVRNALRDLVQFNHLQRENSGASGRGVVGQYRLILPVAETAAESRNDEARNVGVDLNHSRNDQDAIPETDKKKLGNVVPPLPYSSIDLPESRLNADELATDWEVILTMATKRFGVDLVKSWLSDLELAGIDGEVGIILAPNRFVADRVFAQFGDHLQQWWMQQRSAVRLVRLVARA